MDKIEAIGRARQALRQALDLVREAGRHAEQVPEAWALAESTTDAAHLIASALETADTWSSRLVRRP